jgi:hypothetical protein
MLGGAVVQRRVAARWGGGGPTVSDGTMGRRGSGGAASVAGKIGGGGLPETDREEAGDGEMNPNQRR